MQVFSIKVCCGVLTYSLLFVSPINADQCNLENKTIILDYETCLEGGLDEHCSETKERTILGFENGRALVQYWEKVGFELSNSEPEKDLSNAIQNLDKVEKAVMSDPSHLLVNLKANILFEQNSIPLDSEISEVLFGRWDSTTESNVVVTISQDCSHCRLKTFKAITNKVGFSPNIQLAGESTCSLAY